MTDNPTLRLRDALNFLAAGFPGLMLSADNSRAYRDELSTLDPDTLDSAVRTLRVSCDRFPSIAALRAECERIEANKVRDRLHLEERPKYSDEELLRARSIIDGMLSKHGKRRK